MNDPEIAPRAVALRGEGDYRLLRSGEALLAHVPPRIATPTMALDNCRCQDFHGNNLLPKKEKAF
jgi:hypothetical protein